MSDLSTGTLLTFLAPFATPVLAQALRLLLPKPLTAMQTRAAHPGSARRRRFRRLLRPSSHFAVAELERTHRIPLEPSVDSRGRVNWMRRAMIALIWPTFAKPAFLLSTWCKVDGSTMCRSRDGFTIGGYRLLLRVPDSESRAHLRASLATAVVRATRILLICTPETYLSRSGPVHCCAINGFQVKLSSERPDTVVVYSADRPRRGLPSYRVIPRSEVPPDGIWLLSLDRRDDPHAQGSGLTRRFRPIDDYRPARARMARIWFNLRERGNELRPSDDPCLRSRLPPFMLFTVLSLTPLLLLMLYATSLRDSIHPTAWFIIKAVAFLLYQIWAWYISFAVGSLLVRGLDAPPRWTATTVRCLTDGAHIRNGLYRHLCRQQRTRIHPD